MHLIDDSSAVAAPPAPGSAGTEGYFTDGNPISGLEGTLVPAWWLNMLQLELAAVVAAGGVARDKADNNQVLQALRRMFGGAATVVSADTTLTVVSTGLVVVDATAGDITVTLPAAAPIPAARLAFARVDGSAHTVTLARAAADTVDSGVTVPLTAWRQLQADGASRWLTTAAAPTAQEVPMLQCALSVVGAEVVLGRHLGRYLWVAGSNRQIPAAGVSLSPAGLSAGTTYYLYAAWSGSTLTLESSVTGPAVDTETGVVVKTGDATRTLVGQARPVAGPAWADSASQRLVRSWPPRPNAAQAARGSQLTTSSGTPTSLGLALEWLSWGGERVVLASTVQAQSSSAQSAFSMLVLDASQVGPQVAAGVGVAGTINGTCGSTWSGYPGAGYHSADVEVWVGGGISGIFAIGSRLDLIIG